MGARGSNIALGQPERRDEAGHSLPSHVFMQFVAIEVACQSCHRQGAGTVLGTWAVETRAPHFDPGQVHQRGDNSAVAIEEVPDGLGGVRRRFKMRCPRCRATPVLREDKVDEWLGAVYEPGAVAMIHRIHW